MTSKTYVVTDLGPGDGGKGGVVHKISCMMRPHTIIKEGGAQGSHGVRTSNGEQFAFSQWGCGTFEGVKTHISPRMIINPEGLLNEANALRYKCGVYNPFDLLTIDCRALCATTYHGIASRLKEMARGIDPRGTIGTGVGEAYRDFQRFPEQAIRACDLSRSDLKVKLSAVRESIQHELRPIIQAGFLPADQEEVNENLSLLYDDKFLQYVVEKFHEVSVLANIVDEDFLLREVLSQEGVAVVEKSHGILTDHFSGFHPHTSAIRTLPCFTEKMLRDAGYQGKLINIGVTRAYQIRHGAGPMPTADSKMSEHLLPGSNKQENRYQGKVRVGPLDLVLLRYAIEVCGGPSAFDGLAITWFDQIMQNGAWKICESYKVTDEKFFTSSGAIKVHRGEDEEQLIYQEALGKQLIKCSPSITNINLPKGARREEMYTLCAKTLQEKVGIPVRMVSFGPTELDKICR